MVRKIFSLLVAVGFSVSLFLTASAASASPIPTVCPLCGGEDIQLTEHHEAPWYVVGYVDCTEGIPGVLDSSDERTILDLYTCKECNWGKSILNKETRTYHRYYHRPRPQ